MKILILGATGYLGGRISDYLAKSGHDVYCSVRKLPTNSEKWQSKMKKILHGDITSPELFAEVRRLKFDACIYLISLDHHQTDLLRAEEIGVRATWQYLDLSQKIGASRFIYFSTQQVYGPFTATSHYNEDTTVHPKNIYGLTHALSENLCNYYHGQGAMLALNLRLSNALGAPLFASEHVDSLVAPDLCRMALRRGSVRLQSDGSPQRNFILLEDVCRAVELLLGAESSALKYNTFNLGSPTTFSLVELASLIASRTEKITDRKVAVLLNDGREVTDFGSYKDTAKFSYPINRLGELGFNPSADLTSGVDELIAFYSK